MCVCVYTHLVCVCVYMFFAVMMFYHFLGTQPDEDPLFLMGTKARSLLGEILLVGLVYD